MALCGGCGRHMALRNLQLHSRNDDDNEKLLHSFLFCNFFHTSFDVYGRLTWRSGLKWHHHLRNLVRLVSSDKFCLTLVSTLHNRLFATYCIYFNHLIAFWPCWFGDRKIIRPVKFVPAIPKGYFWKTWRLVQTCKDLRKNRKPKTESSNSSVVVVVAAVAAAAAAVGLCSYSSCTPWVQKSHLILPVTLPNVDRFSKFF